MNEDIKDIIEVIELSKEEVENNDENVTAILDLQDLKALKNLYDLYKQEKEKNTELEENLKIATAMLTKGTYPEKNEGDNDFNKKFIPVDKIKEALNIPLDEETNTDLVSLIKTIFDECERLEDIEDRKVQIEYENVFNKGVNSIKDKMKEIVEKSFDEMLNHSNKFNCGDMQMLENNIMELLEEV